MARPRALIVHAHPSSTSFSHRLAATTVAALDTSCDTTLLDLYRADFDPVMTADELRAYQAGEAPTDPVVRSHIELVLASHTLAFVYPTWWSGLPAILKGWLEKTMGPGVAFEYDERRRVRPALSQVRRIIGVTTYGSPRWKMAVVGDGGRRTIHRGIRLSAPQRVDRVWLGMHALDTSTAEQREAFISDVESRLTSL